MSFPALSTIEPSRLAKRHVARKQKTAIDIETQIARHGLDQASGNHHHRQSG